MSEPIQITEELKRRLDESDAKGLAEYGATVDRTDFTPEQWVDHLVGELLDGAKYAMAMKARVTAVAEERDALQLTSHRLQKELTIAQMALNLIATPKYTSNGDGTESDNVPTYRLREIARLACQPNAAIDSQGRTF
jgi:hypothetical protein